MAVERRDTQLLVLGAGPGGYAAAFRAADLGLDVTLVDPEAAPGGVCLHRGCIPSKALLHVATLIEEARRASAFGVDFGEPTIDLERLRAFKDDVVGRLTGGLAQLCKARGVTYLQGRGRLLDAHSAHIDCVEARRIEIGFEHVVLATGSRPIVPESLRIDSPRVMTSSGALALGERPNELLVVGGGYIGLELGSVYAALGSRVTVVEATDSLLPGVDRDLVRVLARSLESRFAAIHTGTEVAALSIDGDSVQARLRTGDGECDERFDAVLVAVGRRPNSSGLGLESTRVEIDERGFIRVDEARRTAEPSILAIGDLCGEPMLAHKATHEGLVAAEVAAGRAAAFEPQAIPAIVFTDPEIAWCGMTEDEARAAGIEVQTARFPWQASGRALTLGRNDGLTKLIVDAENQRVLGVGIVGPGAGELIGEATLAIEMGATTTDLAAIVHAHPTLSETLMEAAEAFHGRSLHYWRRPSRSRRG
ncbi:MAG: dihydrolipoyl dehydrogenase [Deltaproteobacteria bacterium]|nr:MAG: dihydrolipoyl dehydrogenase [Deltaproteobacteria bacterium]